MDNPYAAATFGSVASADVDTRATFLKRVYGHLFVALLAFTGLEVVLIKSGAALGILSLIQGAGMIGWLVVMAVMVGASWIANSLAHNSTSQGLQYLGLGIYVLAEALIFSPLILVANMFAPGVVENAALITALIFTGLTVIVFKSARNFSFLRPVVTFGFMGAMIAIVASMIFGFSMGIWFSFLMAGLAGVMILYQTSNVMNEYPEDRYVGASLGLLASVLLLFWYVIQILMSLQND